MGAERLFENDALNALHGFQKRLPPHRRDENSQEPIRVHHGFDDGRTERDKRVDARRVQADVCPTTRGVVACLDA